MLQKKTDYINLYNSYWEYFPQDFMRNILVGTGRKGELLVRDYVRALRLLALLRNVPNIENLVHSLNTDEDALALLHPLDRFRCRFDSVNLAARYDELKPATQRELFDSSRWVMTEKINGFRTWLGVWNAPGAEPRVSLHSRNYSDVDCNLQDYWDHVFQEVTIPSDTCMILDCECVFDGDIDIARSCGLIAENQLGIITSLMQLDAEESLAVQRRYREKTGNDMVSFALLHPLYFDRKNYCNRTLGYGMEQYDNALEKARSFGLNVRSIHRCAGCLEEKNIILENILSSGGEGVVFHNVDGRYTASENRDKTSWVKLKRSVLSTYKKDGLGDTIDAYVTGYRLGNPGSAKENLVASLECSVNLVEADGSYHSHVIGYVSGLPHDFLERNTVVGEFGKPTLNPLAYGKVGVIDGQCITARNLRLQHPKLIEWRFDKTKEECSISRVWLESQVL